MANEATILRIRAQVENLEGLNRARSAVRNFATESKAASNDLDKLRSLFKELGSESVRSVNNLKNYRTGLDALRQSAEIGSTTFKELTSEIRQLDTELGSLQGKQTQVAQGFNKITTATNSAIAAQRTYSGLIRNPLTGGYSMPPVQVPMGGRLLPAAQGFDFAAQDSRIQAQAAEASAQSARDARRRAKMQELANYSGTTIGARDPNTGALIAGGYGPFQNVGTQYNRPAGPQAAPVRARTNFGALAGGLGAVAAGGVFGGPEGAGGALIGLGVGGVAGAAAGAAIGAQVGMLRQAIGATAEYAAQIDKLNIALKSIAGSSSEYAAAQSVIASAAKNLNIPVLDSTQSFTRLAASVNGAGGKVADSAFVFRSFAQAIKATGGGVEQTNGVMLALTQIFSKGKVSAEEVNQIAERLPGTFTLFAKAAGKTGPEMQKAFEQGAIGLNDLMKFAAELDRKYSASAANMAASTEEAGARMKVALDELGKTFGDFFKPVGAGIQDLITKFANLVNNAFRSAQLSKKLAEFNQSLTPAENASILKDARQIGMLRSGRRGKYEDLNFAQRTQVDVRTDEVRRELERNAMTQKLYNIGAMETPTIGALSTFAPPKGAANGAANTEKSNKAAENAAQRLREKIKQQLADADKLFALETARLDITLAATKQEELEAKYNKVIVERREKYLSLQKNAVSEQERMRIAEAQSVAIIADRQTYLGEINKLMQEQTKELYAQVGLSATLNKNLQAALAGAFTGGTATGTFRTDVDLMPGLTGGKLGGKMEELRKELETLNDPINQIITGAEQIGTAFSESFTGLINGSMTAQESLGNFFRNIGNYFLDMASKMIAKYIEMQIIGLAQKFLPGMFGGIFGPNGAPDFSGSSVNVPNQYGYGVGPNILASANGNVFAQNGIVPFANGGIVDRPMMFPFAKGIGLMGEAGPEAIMPLKRGADGKLGVAGGSGGTSVTVNVDASGSSVQGDKGQSAALGRAIAASVQAELVKQKRPGGLLA
jgi:tape measure domain-containing protein